MDWSNPWLIGTLALIVGVGLGVGVSALLARRGGAGQSLDALRDEFDDYREEVNEHFAQTSELFREMTEKYRDVYNHLATGAQSFGKDVAAAPRLELVEDAEPEPSDQTET